MLLTYFICKSISGENSSATKSLPKLHQAWYQNIPDEQELKPQYKFKQNKFGRVFWKKFIKATKNTSKININDIKLLIDKDFPPAIHLMGELYEFGYGNLTQNTTKAIEYFKKAAKFGYQESYSSLAFYYRYGIGLDQPDDLISEIYYSNGEKHNSIRSLLANALSYTFGLTRPYSLRHASSLILEPSFYLAKLMNNYRGNRVELSRLNFNYQLFKNNSADENLLTIINSRAAAGNEEAEIDLAIAKIDGIYGSDIDYEYARQILEKYPNNGRANAILGFLYHHGKGVPKNLSIAFDKYSLAAEKGNLIGQEGLCILKDEGYNVDENERDDIAAQCYKDLYIRDSVGGFRLGLKLLKGTKTMPQNVTQAYLLFEPYLKQKDPLQLAIVAEMFLRGQYKYDKKQAMVYIWDIMQYGPWNNLGKSAEEFYKNKEYSKALLAWLMLGDIGMEKAAYNAGMMIVNYNNFFKEIPFGLTERRFLKMGVRMLKISKNLGNGDATLYLSRALIKLNETNKAAKWLSLDTNSTFVKFEYLKFMLDGSLNERNYLMILDRLKSIKPYMALMLTPKLVHAIVSDIYSFLFIEFNQTKFNQILSFLKEYVNYDFVIFTVLFIIFCILLRIRLSMMID